MSKIIYIYIINFIIMMIIPLVDSYAQSCYSSSYHWPENSVTYHINSNLQTSYATQADYENAIEAAIQSWNDAGGNFHFNRGNNVNYNRGQEPAGIYQIGRYAETSNILAYSIINATNDEITKVETYYNQSYQLTLNPESGQYDIQSTTLHELGHWLDLNDEYDFWCYFNVMYYLLDDAEIKRDLTIDDSNGIIYIYGENPGITFNNPFLNNQPFIFNTNIIFR